MSGDEKINVKINKNWGITQALKKLVKDAGENVKGSVWNATLDKLVELNNQRKTDNKGSIFSGGTERNDWHRNFVVHEGNIEFSKSEMEALLDTMQVSEGVKNRILGEAAPAAGTEPPTAGTEPPTAGTEPPTAGTEPPAAETETPPTGEGKTQEEIEELAHEKGYRGTEHAGTFYDEKTKTHYQWDNETGDFKARPDIKQINEDGSYIDQQGVEHAAEVAETPAAGEGKTQEEIAQAAQQKGYRATAHDGTFYDEQTKTHYRWDDERGDFKAEENIETIYKNGIYLGKDGKHYLAPGEVCNGPVFYEQDGKNMCDEYDDGVLVQREIHNINDDESGTVETYDPNNNLLKTEEYASGGRIIKVTKGNAVSTYSYNDDNSYTVTKKVDGKLNQITDYNSEGQEVRDQYYNDEEVLEEDIKYTYQPDGRRVANVEYYLVEADEDYCVGSHGIQQKQGDEWYEATFIAQRKDGKYYVFVDMNMNLASTTIGREIIVAATEEEAKALQEELLALRELYSEIAYYDKDGERRDPEITDERKAEIAAKLAETISNTDKPLEVRQAAAFAATEGVLYEDETLQNAIIDTKDAGIINRLEGTDLKPEQWEKIYNMALDKEFRKSYGYPDVYRMLIGYKYQYSLNSPDEVRFKAFNNLPRSWDKNGMAYHAIPQLPVAFLNENWKEIKPEDAFYLLARSKGEMDKETFDTKFIPSIPANPTAVQINIIKNGMEYLPDEVKADYHLIESGDRFYNIIMDKILANPSIIERLGKKTDWDDSRKKEAINEYIKDFGADIAKQLGIDDPSKIQPGQILDFSKVKWPQPDGQSWFFNY